jgi:hypothetical protein
MMRAAALSVFTAAILAGADPAGAVTRRAHQSMHGIIVPQVTVSAPEGVARLVRSNAPVGIVLTGPAIGIRQLDITAPTGNRGVRLANVQLAASVNYTISASF